MCEKDLVNPDKPQVPVVNPYFSVAGAVNAPNTPYTLGYLAGNPSYPNGVVSVLTQSVQVPAGGLLTLQLTALRPGVSMIRFVDPALQPPPSPNFAWDNCDFAIVRILPYNDYSGYTDQQINSWTFIYANFFGFYSVLYPAMSKLIPWGPTDAPNNPAEVRKLAAQMMSFTKADMWYSTIYMPITRDLSGGQAGPPLALVQIFSSQPPATAAKHRKSRGVRTRIPARPCAPPLTDALSRMQTHPVQPRPGALGRPCREPAARLAPADDGPLLRPGRV